MAWGRSGINDKNADANERDKSADELIKKILMQCTLNLLKIQQSSMKDEWEYK